jgi:hypothetical protein
LRLAGHQARIDAVAYAPDGRTVASAGSDGTVCIWDATGRLKEGQLPPVKPTERELAALWRDLSGSNGEKAYRAAWTLTAAGKAAVPFLGERLGKVPGDGESAGLRRAVEVLEQIGSPEARRALDQALTGKAGTEIIEAAQLSLHRLAARKGK